MSISGIGSGSAWSTLDISQTKRTRPPRGGGLDADLTQLQSDLAAGNADQAKADLATIQQRAKQARGDGDDPLSSALSSISDALQGGDLDAASKAVASLKSDLAAHAQEGPPPPPPGGADGASSGDGTDALDSLLQSLQSALQSGDSSASQDAFKQLLQYFRQSAADAGTSDSFAFRAIDTTV